MAPAILKAVLDQNGVTGSELIDLLDDCIACGKRDFDSRDEPTTPVADRLPPMQVELAAGGRGGGSDLLFYVNLERIAVSLLHDVVQVRVSDHQVPRTVANMYNGQPLTKAIFHPIFVGIDVRMLACDEEGRDVVFDVEMPLVALDG